MRRCNTGSDVMTVSLPCWVSLSKIAATVRVLPSAVKVEPTFSPFLRAISVLIIASYAELAPEIA